MNAIGGSRLKFKQKAELTTERREAWLHWCGQDTVEGIMLKRSWTLNEVLAGYTELFNDRVADDEDRCASMHKDTTIKRLIKLMAMKLGGIQMGAMDPKQLIIDMMVDELWPS